MTALKRGTADRIPLGIHLSASKYDEFVCRTGHRDPFHYFGLDYRYVPLERPRALPDFSRYFNGRVPDWPDMSRSDFSLVPFRMEKAFFMMGEHNTALNEWGEYRVYDDSRDFHRKVFPLNHPDCTIADVENYPFPDLLANYRYAGVEQAVRSVHEQNLAAVLHWEMTIFEKAWRIRGMEELMMDLSLNPELVDCLVEKIAERTGYLALRYAQAGVDIIQFGDDIACQRGMLISPLHWRRYIKPHMARMIARVKEASPDILVFYHTDGAVETIVPDLIDIGVDILNPVQPECNNIALLKHLYGNRLSFWGGIGVQSTLPFGTPVDVRNAVRKLIEDAGSGGGLLVAPAHLIERDVPWDNVLAFVAAMREFGGGESR